MGLSQVEVVDEGGITESFLKGIETFTLKVLNERESCRRKISGLDDAGKNCLSPQLLVGPPANLGKLTCSNL